MKPSHGWTIFGTGPFGLIDSGGFYVWGFPTIAEAVVWLSGYLLELAAQQRREALERDRILAAMQPHGGVA